MAAEQKEKLMIPLIKTQTIDWGRIARAVAFYQSKGFIYVEVPWMVDDSFVRPTYPEDVPQKTCFATEKGTLVGSAEQSFLAYKKQGGNVHGHKRMVAVTPCFRDHQPKTHFHQPWFMKVELWSEDPNFKADKLMLLAGEFFAKEGTFITMEETDIGFDWKVGDIEIGSYGNRTWGKEEWSKTTWSYGTGLAEPRFSQALKEQKKVLGRHLDKTLNTKTEDMNK